MVDPLDMTEESKGTKNSQLVLFDFDETLIFYSAIS